MVTGRRAFEGRSQASLIAAIMGSEPPEPSSVASGCPPALDRLVRRCLAKDPDDRWQSAIDLASELKWIGQEKGSESASVAAARREILSRATGIRERAVWAGVALVLLAATALLAARALRGTAEQPRLVRAAWLPPVGTRFDSRYAPSVSPDGRTIAFVAIWEQGQPPLWVRELGAVEARGLPDTAG